MSDVLTISRESCVFINIIAGRVNVGVVGIIAIVIIIVVIIIQSSHNNHHQRLT